MVCPELACFLVWLALASLSLIWLGLAWFEWFGLDRPPCLAVLLGEEGHLQLEGGGVGQVLGLLLDVLVLHPLHILLLFTPAKLLIVHLVTATKLQSINHISVTSVTESGQQKNSLRIPL